MPFPEICMPRLQRRWGRLGTWLLDERSARRRSGVTLRLWVAQHLVLRGSLKPGGRCPGVDGHGGERRAECDLRAWRADQ